MQPITGCIFFISNCCDMGKRLRLCTVLTLLAAGLVFGLVIISKIPANRSNDFVRRLPPHFLNDEREFRWPINPWRLAGSDDSAFYLAHRGLLNVIMRAGRDTTVISAKMASGRLPNFSDQASLSVDKTAFYIADGKAGDIYMGDKMSWTAAVADSEMPFFDREVTLADKVFFRTILPEKGFVLGVKDFRTHAQLLFQDLPGGQTGALFDKDGMLLKDNHYSFIVYVYRYRNQFVVMDTSLRLLYSGKTIDTVAHVHIQTGKANQGRTIKMAAPPPVVNQSACTANGYLYIKSALKADNESPDIFNNASVIDIYHLKSGDYVNSFYVSDHNHEKMKEFAVRGNKLAALYPHSLKLFEFGITLPPANPAFSPRSSAPTPHASSLRSSSDHR